MQALSANALVAGPGFEIGYLVASIDLLIGVLVIVMLGTAAEKQLRGDAMHKASLALLVTSVVYIGHGSVEVLKLGELLYALTALGVTLLLGYALVQVHRSKGRREGTA